jgi:hypothetical protein
MGMTCYAGHGKLHESQRHVHDALIADGMDIQHQNAYYVSTLTEQSRPPSFRMATELRDGIECFRLLDGSQILGTASAGGLKPWT